MKNFLLLITIVLSTSAEGQKHDHHGKELTPVVHPSQRIEARQWFAGVSVDPVHPEQSIRAHILHQMPELAGSELRLMTTVESPAGQYYHFHQFIDGYPVFGARGVAQIGPGDKLRMITTNFYPTEMRAGEPFETELIITSLEDLYTMDGQGYWLYDGELLQPVLREVYTGNDGEFEERFWNAQGEFIWSRDMNMYQDTTINVKVFNPDPLTTLGTTYGFPYTDQNDQNTSILDPQRIQKTITAYYLNGTFHLRNDHVEIAEFSDPILNPVTRTDPDFFYSRNQAGFEQVMALYHITTFKEHMLTLGHNLVNYSIPVDAQALGGGDNSMFTPGSPRLYFGIGGVDDAEDADVILHEYGHAIAHSASPWSNSGVERGALDEALGDYIATSYSRHLNTYGYERVFTWDGHNEFWNGRWANNPLSKNYKNISFNNIYQHTDLWVDALMAIWSALGRDYTDKIVLQSTYGYATNMTYSQAAELINDADQVYTGGANYVVIWTAFSDRGILPPLGLAENNGGLPVRFLNTSGFASGEELLVLMSGTGGYSYQLSDLRGRVVNAGEIEPGTSTWYFSGTGLSKGVYLLNLTDENGNHYVEKLVRY